MSEVPEARLVPAWQGCIASGGGGTPYVTFRLVVVSLRALDSHLFFPPHVASGCCLPPLCDIPSGCCFFTGPETVTRSSLRMLRRVVAFCRLLRPVLLLVSFPRSRSPVVGVLALCWMWHGVPFAR